MHVADEKRGKTFVSEWSRKWGNILKKTSAIQDTQLNTALFIYQAYRYGSKQSFKQQWNSYYMIKYC